MSHRNGILGSSLTSRILFAVIGLLLLFGGLATFFVYVVSSQNLLSINMKSQLKITKDKTQDIETVIDDVFIVLKQLSSEKILVEGLLASSSPTLAKQATEKLKSYLITDFYSTIYVMGTNGIALFSTDPAFVGGDYSFRPYFTEALKGSTYADVGLGITTDKLGYYFSHPLYKEGKIVGVCIIKTNPNKINKIVNYDSLKIDSEIIITDDKGVILYSSKPNRVYSSLGILSPDNALYEQTNRYPGQVFTALDYGGVQNFILNNSVSGMYQSYDKIDSKTEILTYAKVGKYPFYFIIEADVDPYISMASSSALIISLFILFAMLFMSFILVLLLRALLSPINTLVQAADEIGKGNFSYKIPEFSINELSNLAGSLKKMSINLQNLYSDIEQKVSERTKKLDEQNERLNKSEALLKDTLETSERANKLMVGRELEMLELKKIIKTLQEKNT